MQLTFLGENMAKSLPLQALLVLGMATLWPAEGLAKVPTTAKATAPATGTAPTKATTKAAGPPSKMTARSKPKRTVNGTCVKEVFLARGQQSLMGWIGDELVTFFRDEDRVFGSHHNQPVRMKIIGTEDQGYRVFGTIGGKPVNWKMQDNWVFGDVENCQPATNVRVKQ